MQDLEFQQKECELNKNGKNENIDWVSNPIYEWSMILMENQSPNFVG